MKARKLKPIGAKRPIHVFYDPVSKKMIAAQFYVLAGKNQVAVYGPKYDVTEDIRSIIQQYDPFTVPCMKKTEGYEGEATSP